VAPGRRRDAILAAARSAFAREGYAGARIERIAEAAHVNKQLIFHYFHSKEALYSAVVSSLFASWQPAQDTGAPPSERLRRLTDQIVQWLSDNPGAARAIAEAGSMPRQADTTIPAREAMGWLAATRSAVRSAVEGGQRQGYFRDDVDPQAVAEIVASSAVGHALTADTAGETSPSESQRLSENLARALVEYCAWR
jgi:TetR/AcrR family transcriptional regulator